MKSLTVRTNALTRFLRSFANPRDHYPLRTRYVRSKTDEGIPEWPRVPYNRYAARLHDDRAIAEMFDYRY